mgnify:CR=1 FL=1
MVGKTPLTAGGIWGACNDFARDAALFGGATSRLEGRASFVVHGAKSERTGERDRSVMFVFFAGGDIGWGAGPGDRAPQMVLLHAEGGTAKQRASLPRQWDVISKTKLAAQLRNVSRFLKIGFY